MLNICSTGINRLRDDDAETRTLEIEVGDFDVSPAVRMKALIKVRFVPGERPTLYVTAEDGSWLETEFKPSR